MINELRELVRRILILEKKADDQKSKDNDDKKNILTEPDEVEDKDDPSNEYYHAAPFGTNVVGFSISAEAAAGGVAGVSTPLGTGPTFPLKKKKRKRKNS